MIRGVVFDLDDTLYPEREFVRSGLAASAAWLEREHGVAGLFEEAWPRFAAGERGRLFDHALERLGHAAPPELIAELVAVYRAHEPAIALAPDIVRLLDRLHVRGPLALLTDGYHVAQQQKVKALGLARWCRPIVCTDAFGRAHWKPSPKGFLAIQDALGLAPQELVYVADNPAKDFRAPRALGWCTIRLRRPGGEHAGAEPAGPADAADCTIEALAELLSDRLLDPPRRNAG
jgi:putative hydrolase of the HAD superfamily